jgi:hypothetical protein
MKTKAVFSVLLSGLLIACATMTATSLPTGMISSPTNGIATQTLSQTVTPLPTATWTQTPAPTLTTTPTPLPKANFILERVAQTGGGIQGITIVGDLAYLGMGPRLAAVDISQHAQPKLVSQSGVLPGRVTQVLQISGEPAPLLLVSAGKYLVMMDGSNPAGLKPINQLALDGAITAMAWDSRTSILYSGGSIYRPPWNYTGFISAVRITPDHRLELSDSVPMPERPLSLALGNGSLFAGAEGDGGGLYHVQLNTPGKLSSPNRVIASTPEKPLQPLRMQVVGERLYLSYQDIEAYDITNPDQPRQIWAGSTNGNVVKDFQISGDQIYVFGWTILSEYVHYTITILEAIAGSPIGVTACVTATHNGDFLVAYNDLEIYDIAASQSLQIVGNYQPVAAHVIGAVADDKAVFVVDDGIGDGNSDSILWVLSLPDLKPFAQVMTGFPNGYTDGFRAIALDQERLYLATAKYVWTYDVSSPEPHLLGKTTIADGQVNSITVGVLAEKRLLAISLEVARKTNVLAVYDLTNPQKPVRLGNLLTLDQGRIEQTNWRGSALYVLVVNVIGCNCDNLQVFDFENNALVLRDSLPFPPYTYANTIGVDQNLVALTSTEGLSIVSAVGSKSLKLQGQAPLPEVGLGVAILEEKALVVVGKEYGAAQLLAFDIHDPGKPRQVTATDISISDLGTVPILMTPSYVVLANGIGGVEVFSGAS